MKTLTFATLATPRSVDNTFLLLESLRRFGGEYAASPALALTPTHAGSLPSGALERLKALDAQLVPFDMPPELRTFPLAVVPAAAAAAEQAASEEAASNNRLLAWILQDALVLNPPAPFDLPDGIDFAYRPVHHTLIGSLYDRPPDDFWSLVYQHCGTPPERLFPMQSCVRDHTIRPYFNAGLAVVRPELDLLSAWNETFARLAHHPDFEPFYQQDQRYAVFIHQAVLSALIPARLERGRMLELPESINYPVHLHADYPAAHRPARLNDLITCRYEEFAVLQQALDAGFVDEPLKGWLKKLLETLTN